MKAMFGVAESGTDIKIIVAPPAPRRTDLAPAGGLVKADGASVPMPSDRSLRIQMDRAGVTTAKLDRLFDMAARGQDGNRGANAAETPLLENGELVLPDRPGLGLKFDEKALAAFKA